MTDFIEKIWIIDESRLTQTFIDAHTQGKAVIHDGVAYWASGSGKTGIIEHLPFKEAVFKTAEQAIQAAQATTIIAAAASTAIILGAIIVQTKYLANKIEKLQAVADLISKDLHTNNILFYIDQISSYYGELEAAKLLIQDRSIAPEIKDIAGTTITNLIAKRNKILLLVDNIIKLAETDQFSDRHLGLVLNFAQLTLDLMPKGIYLEYLLSARTARIGFAEVIIIDGRDKYEYALGQYKSHLNKMHKSVLNGTIGGKIEIFAKIESDAKELFQSKQNKLLLASQPVRAAITV
jgi:hypothetical protein